MSRNGVIRDSLGVLPILRGLFSGLIRNFANFLGIVCALVDLCYREPSYIDLALISFRSIEFWLSLSAQKPALLGRHSL